jgi:hypothetical protein
MIPSVKALRSVFNDPEQARAILSMSRAQLEQLPVCQARIAECYHPPATYDLRLTALDQLAETHGIEGAQASTGGWLLYLNAGDTYAPTVTYWECRYRVESWGDRVEKLERRRITFP